MVSRKLQHSEEGLLLGSLAMAVLLAIAFFSGSGAGIPFDPPGVLLLHTLLELVAVLTCFSVYIVNWEASKQIHNSRSLLVATGFLAVATISAVHTLSYPGFPDILTPNSMSKALGYASASGFVGSVVLLASAMVRPDQKGWYLGRYALVGCNMVVVLLVLVCGSQWPLGAAGHEEVARTRVVLEALTAAVNVGAVVAYLRQNWEQRDESAMTLFGALGANTLAHVAFALTRNAFDLFDLMGHVYQAVAYYGVFRAMLVPFVHRPYVDLKLANAALERTVAELDARNRELDALDDVALSLSGTLKPNEILESAIEKVMVVMQASAGAIFLREEDTDRLRLTAWRGLRQDVVRDCLSRAPWAQVQEGLPEGSCAAGDPPGSDGATGRMGGMETRISSLSNCLCAPIRNKGRLMGVIVMVGNNEREFGQRDTDLLTAIAYQLGMAIENAQLYAQTDERLREKVIELQRAERRSRFLFEVGALFGSGTEIKDALREVCRRSVEVLGDWCSIYLLDEHGKQLRLAATYHVDSNELALMRELLLRRPVPLGEGIVGRVAERGEAILSATVPVEEVASEARLLARSVEEIAILRAVAPHSRIAVPMRALGRTVGVLVVMSTHSRQQFGREDLSLAVELADRAGAAIETARLFQDIQAQRQHLEAIISQMVDGVVVTDALGRVVVCNAAAQKMLGEGIGQLLGTTPAGSTASSGKNVRAKLAPGPLVPSVLAGEVVLGESLTVSHGGRDQVLSASASPVRSEEGEILGAVVALRDVTAEREVERIKDEFVATVSHELRTPITAILGYTDILLRGLRGQLNPKQFEAMSAVRNAGQRLLALINDLLDMSRLEAGKQAVSLVPLDLPSCLRRAKEAVAMLAGTKGIVIETKVPAVLPKVLADDELLQRILGNLLSNAVKFTPEGGTITISAVVCGGQGSSESSLPPPGDLDGAAVAVMVSDTGVGIAPEHQERIWDKFQQVDSSSRRMFGGTGLGLSITKRLVELHGGRVWVESQGVPGKGSTFGFTLHVADPTTQS